MGSLTESCAHLAISLPTENGRERNGHMSMAKHSFSYLPGVVVGNVKILSRARRSETGHGRAYDYQCTRCAHIAVIQHDQLVAFPNRKGCVKCRKAPNLVGVRFGRLLVVGNTHISSKRDNLRWVCKCDCGATKVVKAVYLVEGKTKSCGCLKREYRLVHGLSGHPLYTIYNGIIGRCLRPNHISYPQYGGRGITVDPAWVSDVSKFIKDITAHLGDRPSHRHSLDRIDYEKGYYVENLRWATQDQQMKNRRVVLSFLSEDKSERVVKTFASIASLHKWVLSSMSEDGSRSS